MLKKLGISGVAPIRHQSLDFGERLNVITGDNGVGKTLVLDLCWYALTRTWVDSQEVMVRPARNEIESGEPPWLVWDVVGRSGTIAEAGATFEFRRQGWDPGEWVPSAGRPPMPGVVLYARVDGGFSVWDPLRNYWRQGESSADKVDPYHFSREQVWRGLRDIGSKDGRNLCNGLLRDVETWRLKGNGAFETLKKVLVRLSSDKSEELSIGAAVQVRLGDEDLVPTLHTSYGSIPMTQAAAGVKRVLALAYLLVWAREAHLRAAELLGEAPEDRMVLLFDEVEAHLHPKWQRVFLPALSDVVSSLLREEGMRSVQIIATTHAPLVLASIEPIFDESRDKLWTFELSADHQARLVSRPWAMQGDATKWLVSESFGLKQARSIEAQEAIEAAEAWMRGDIQALPVGLGSPQAIDAKLRRVLAGHDRFWPRWIVHSGQHFGEVVQ